RRLHRSAGHGLGSGIRAGGDVRDDHACRSRHPAAHRHSEKRARHDMTRTVVLASSNAGKLREINQILAGLEIEALPQSQFHVPEVEETGLSFVENAILKARHAAHYAHLPAIADDSG